MGFNQRQNAERLFLNTLPFSLPKEPVKMYFSLVNRDDVPLRKIHKSIFPVELLEQLPDATNLENIWTSFNSPFDGLSAVDINFRRLKNFAFVKRFYNREICHYFNKKNCIVEPNEITKDNQIWFHRSRNDQYAIYDKFTLKVDLDHFHKRAQLVLSFDRPTCILTNPLSSYIADDPLNPGNDNFIRDNLVRVMTVKRKTDSRGNRYVVRHIDNYRYLSAKPDFDLSRAYAIVNNKIADFLGIDTETDEDKADNNIQYNSIAPGKNRYERYYDKIRVFFQKHLDNEDFRSIIPIATEFQDADTLQIGKTRGSSKELIFSGGVVDTKPQSGVNNGPFEIVKYGDVKIICIYPASARDETSKLLRCFQSGYKTEKDLTDEEKEKFPYHRPLFAGLSKYTGQACTFADAELHIAFQNEDDPYNEIRKRFADADYIKHLDTANTRYIAIYVSPISKYATDKEARKNYYRIKEILLQHHIVSQCIDLSKMQLAWKNDIGLDYKGRIKQNFSYTLQNMAIAINAKLGGIPWRLYTEKTNELILGIGAYKNPENNTQYIGSAFSFDNTGSFNGFQCFLKDELKELAGSIEEAIIGYTRACGIPQRLVIHYYKQMSLQKEYPFIEEMLENLGLGDLPVYVVTINKTEAEDIVLFDGSNPNLMPYSGRYINLGDGTFLLCNNTRYENAYFNKMDGYPFPVKLRIACPSHPGTEIESKVIEDLIDQVYQFSRIYWKSVKQQNLPVTVKYTEMIARMMPYFTVITPEDIESDRLWFL